MGQAGAPLLSGLCLILPSHLQGDPCYPHFIDKAMEASRGNSDVRANPDQSVVVPGRNEILWSSYPNFTAIFSVAIRSSWTRGRHVGASRTLVTSQDRGVGKWGAHSPGDGSQPWQVSGCPSGRTQNRERSLLRVELELSRGGRGFRGKSMGRGRSARRAGPGRSSTGRKQSEAGLRAAVSAFYTLRFSD